MIISKERARMLDNLLFYAAVGVFTASILLLIAYQSVYIINTHTSQPFLEPDNYIYLLFVNQALIHPAATPSSITNPYLINAPKGFFEHSGLYLLPLYLSYLKIPIIWAFRLIQLLIIITIYLFSLLFLKKIMYYIPLNKVYHYLAYTILVSGFLLMQYNQIIEWRGSEFITAFTLISIYIIAYAFTENKISKYLISILLVSVLAFLSYWLWSGYFIFILIVLFVIIAMFVYKFFLIYHIDLWKYILFILILFAVGLFFFYIQFEALITSILLFFNYTQINCTTNVLQIGEMNCLNLKNGLVAILSFLIISIFALFVLFQKTIFSTYKNKYEYYLLGVFISACITLPLSFIYIRMISILAPYLLILYALGIVMLFSYFIKTGSSQVILLVSILLVLAGGFAGQYIFFNTNLILYDISNPQNLSYFNSYMISNSTLFTYFGYGGYYETQDIQVYADTIQGLNYTRIQLMNKVFRSPPQIACNLINTFKPKPTYILIGGPTMIYSVLFNNLSSQSILKNPKSFNNTCDYTLIATKELFYLYKTTNAK